MCGPKLHLSLVCMRKYQGVKLLYGNIRTLHQIKAAKIWKKRLFEKEREYDEQKHGE